MSSELKTLNTGKGKPFVILAFIVTLLVSAGFIAVPFLIEFEAFGNRTFYNVFYDLVDMVINLIKTGAPFDTTIRILIYAAIHIFFAVTIVIFAIKFLVNLIKIKRYGYFVMFKMVKSFFFFFVMMGIAFLIASLAPAYIKIKDMIDGGSPDPATLGNLISPTLPYVVPLLMIGIYCGGALLCMILSAVAGIACPDIRMGSKHNVINLIRLIVILMVAVVLFVTPAFTLIVQIDGDVVSSSNKVFGELFDGAMIYFYEDDLIFLGGGIFFAFIPIFLLLIRKPLKAFALQNADYAFAAALKNGQNYPNKINSNRCKKSFKIRLLVTGIFYVALHFALKPILGLFSLPVTVLEFYFFLGFGIASVIGAIVLIVFETIIEKTSPKSESTLGESVSE